MDASRPRIMVIDDDDLFREVVVDLLADAGYEVVTATTAAEGLQKAQELRPGAILLDVTLPDLSGREVLKRLKIDAETSSIPVVMLTGLSVDAADHPLAAAVLTKPVRVDVLLATMARVREGT